MTRPVVLQVFPMMDPSAEEILRAHVDLRTASDPRPETLVREGQDAVAIIGRSPGHVGAEVFDALLSVLLVSGTGSGVNSFDVQAATARGIPVLHNPGVAPGPVAEYVIAAALALLKRILEADSYLREGGAQEAWDPKERFMGRELSGKTVGLVGFGHIGRDLAMRLRVAFQVDVRAYDPFVPDEEFDRAGVERANDLAELLRRADIVSLHVPLNTTTRHLLGGEELALIGPRGILVNASRGAVVDEAALVEALRDGVIAGAAVDVFEEEPPAVDHPLFSLPNVIVTPHLAGMTEEGMMRLSQAVARNLLMALRGERPPHIANGSAEVWPPARLEGRPFPLAT